MSIRVRFRYAPKINFFKINLLLEPDMLNHDHDILKILLVEDDEGHASLLKRNFKRSGIPYALNHLLDGREALQVIEELPPEEISKLVVILDLNLPTISGFEVLEKLKTSPKTSQIPVFVLSTTTNKQEVSRCYSLGCNIFLTKPVEYEEFSEAISNLGKLMKIIKTSC